MGFRVEGLNGLVAKLEAIPGQAAGEMRDEMERIVKDAEGKSVRVAPFEDGDLRASSYSFVDGPRMRPVGEVGYIGPEGYLLVQHEGGWENFMGKYGPKRIENYTTPNTGPKFLEAPWLENKPRYQVAIKDAVKRGLRG